jgi:pre-mRNA-processing factor 19
MSNFKCALSGQCPISDPVALPTGQICSKSLLLKKLTETSNCNPFSSQGTQLDESQFIDLASSPEDQVTPPSTSNSNSIPSILNTLSSEYDALVLELFDTRKALEETRKELSHALYQNDAAVRVIARLVMERDLARRELQVTIESGVSAPAAAGDASTGSNKRQRTDAADGGGGATDANVDVVPADSDEAQVSSKNGIPAPVKAQLKKTWEKLCSTRKAKTKATETYASAEDIEAFKVSKKSYHKTSAKGLVALTGCGDQNKTIVTSSKDKNLTIYDLNADKVSQHISAKITASGCNLLHSVDDTIAMLGANGTVRVYRKDGDEYKAIDIEAELTDVVGIKVHPTGKHLFVAEKSGMIHLYEIEDTRVVQVAEWSGVDNDSKCSSIGIHPDGLILGIGREDGNISLWDLNTEKLAATLKSSSGSGSAITAIEFSEKGVHLASSSEGGVTVWDLRKQKSIASLNHEGKEVECMSFCPIGKYLAYGTADGDVIVSVVKDWDKKVVLSDGKGKVTGLVWGEEAKSLLSSNDTSRIVKLWGN